MSKIVYHHVGGRGGSYPLPIRPPSPHLADFQIVFYDADPDCMEHIRTQIPDIADQVVVLPLAIGATDGVADFFVTFDPYGSSIYRPNKRYERYNSVGTFGRHTLGDVLKVTETRRVKLHRLSTVCEQSGLAPPDFLSLDVQGAEWDVLSGSRDLVERTVLGVDLEVEFFEAYEGQKTFPTVHALLDEMGFELIRLAPGDPMSPVVLPIGLFGEERQAWGDALYLKSVERLSELAGPEIPVRLYKLAFLALLYKQVGYCIHCLEAIEARRASAPDPWGAEGPPDYAAFLDGFFQLCRSWPQVSLPDFSELNTQAMSRSRFLPKPAFEAALKGELAKEREAIRTGYGARHGKNAGYVLKLMLMERTPIETYLAKNGFAELARTIAEKRKAQAEVYLKVLM